MLTRPIKIYTDGSSSPQTSKEAGWGFVMFKDPECTEATMFCGYLAAPSTNNIGELLALTNAVRLLQGCGPKPFKIISDSQYAIGIYERNIHAAAPTLPKANQELSKDLWRAMDSTKARIDLKWVKGHANNAGNELADFAAKAGKNQNDSFVGIGSMELKYGVKVTLKKYFQHPDDFVKYLEDMRMKSNAKRHK